MYGARSDFVLVYPLDSRLNLAAQDRLGVPSLDRQCNWLDLVRAFALQKLELTARHFALGLIKDARALAIVVPSAPIDQHKTDRRQVSASDLPAGLVTTARRRPLSVRQGSLH